MPETLTDAQKVLRNDTGIRMAAALETLANGVEPSTVIAPEYDATQTYAVGDLVMYRGSLYRCTTAITTPEAWTAAHWELVTVGSELKKKYEKPNSGIPKTDLASAVQTSLNKADAAIQLGLTGASVGDLVRVKTVDANGKPTSWNHVPLCDITTNPNLLDNWYFVGGGSQLGDGIFPINQRDLTVYPGDGYSIDRWNASNANGTLTITQDAVTLTASSSGNAFLRQLIKNLPSNTVITVSALIRGSGAGVLRVDNEAGTSTIFNAQSYNNPGSAWTLISGSGTLPDGVGIVTLRANASTSIDIAVIKCELGTEQTLAHQEGGAWVLNEIPDYGDELLKCQRYFQTFRTEALRPTYGADCRPIMAADEPTKGTITIDGVTYYTLTA